MFADFFVMNLILWVKGSSAAIPFGTLVALLALWFCVSVPLTFVGAYFGFKKRVSAQILSVPASEIFFHACSGPRIRVWVGVKVHVRVRVYVRVRFRARVRVRVKVGFRC